MNFAHRLNDGRVGIRRVRHLTTVPQGSIEERCDTLYRPKPIRHASSYRECHSPRLRYAPRRPGFGAAASASAATSSMLQSRAATPAVMAGVTRRLLWMRQKLYQTKYSARAWQCTLRSCRAAMGFGWSVARCRPDLATRPFARAADRLSRRHADNGNVGSVHERTEAEFRPC